MRREIEATTRIRAPLATAIDVLRADPIDVFAENPAHEQRGERGFPLVLGAELGAGASVDQEVLVHVGFVHVADDGSARASLEWTPTGRQRLLPTFVGEIQLRSAGPHRTEVEVAGTYEVPLGVVGRFGDTVVGRRIARRSLSDVVETVARRVDEESDRRFHVASPRPAPYPVSLREGDRSEHFIG